MGDALKLSASELSAILYGYIEENDLWEEDLDGLLEHMSQDEGTEIYISMVGRQCYKEAR